MTEAMISIARDFSRSPAGRHISDGPYSGERFRDQILVPALGQNTTVLVELDGTRGMGSSFLEEAFGGLLRKGFRESELKRKLKLITRDPSLISEIQGYMSA